MIDELASSELDRDIQTHLRNGMPSVILAVVTIVAIFVSYVYVQPSIENRYAARCIENLKQLKLNNVAFVDSKDADFTEVLNSPESIDKNATPERRKLLDETTLSLRRFAFWDKSNDAIRFQEAIVANASAIWYRNQIRLLNDARRNESSNDTVTAAQRWYAIYEQEFKKASDLVASIERLNGPLNVPAKLWRIRQSLDKNEPIGIKDSLQFAADLVAIDPVVIDRFKLEKPIGTLLATLHARRGFEFGNEGGKPLTITARISEAKQTEQLFQQFVPESWPDRVTQCEVQYAIGLPEGRESAWAIAQDYWGSAKSNSDDIERLVGVMRTLLVGGSIEEVESFVSDSIKKLSTIEQSDFRRQVLACCLRYIVIDAMASQTPLKKGELRNELDRVTELAIQVSPDSDELAGFLMAVTSGPASDSAEIGEQQIADHFRERIRKGTDQSVKAFIACITSLNSRAEFDELETVLEGGIAYAILLTKTVLLLHRETKIDNSRAEHLLTQIIELQPDALATKFAKCNLLYSAGRYREAIQCLDELNSRIPNNAQVLDLLEDTRSQLKSSDSL